MTEGISWAGIPVQNPTVTLQLVSHDPEASHVKPTGTIVAINPLLKAESDSGEKIDSASRMINQKIMFPES